MYGLTLAAIIVAEKHTLSCGPQREKTRLWEFAKTKVTVSFQGWGGPDPCTFPLDLPMVHI